MQSAGPYTDRGDAMKARYVVLANGILTTPRASPALMAWKRIRRLASLALGLQYRSRRIACRNYRDERHLCAGRTRDRQSGEGALRLQRPSSIDVRDQRATTQDEIEEWKKEPAWALARRERLATISSGRTALQATMISCPVR